MLLVLIINIIIRLIWLTYNYENNPKHSLLLLKHFNFLKSKQTKTDLLRSYSNVEDVTFHLAKSTVNDVH